MMNIVSWNVNGIRSIVKNDFIKTVMKLDPDIFCIQETRAQSKELNDILQPFGPYEIFSNAALKKGYSGTAILSKRPPKKLIRNMGIVIHDNEGRIQCAEYDEFYLVNVYVPNSGQKLQRLEYRMLWDADFLLYLKRLEKNKPLILCGDLNVAHTPIDLKNDKANYNKTAGYTQIEIDGMDNLLGSGFIDVYRHFYPKTEAYTYWSYRFNARDRNIGWRIDYFIISPNLLNKIRDVKILSDYYGSDHCPIQLMINL